MFKHIKKLLTIFLLILCFSNSAASGKDRILNWLIDEIKKNDAIELEQKEARKQKQEEQKEAREQKQEEYDNGYTWAENNKPENENECAQGTYNFDRGCYDWFYDSR